MAFNRRGVMYKQSKAYKGFEVWYHQLQMSFKMHLYTFIIILLLQMIIPALYLVIFRFDIVKLVGEVFIGFHIHLWLKALILLFKKGFIIFILATPIWLLYPVLLTRFKAKSREIIKDRHLRGTKLISDDELRKIVLNDIKQGRRF